MILMADINHLGGPLKPSKTWNSNGDIGSLIHTVKARNTSYKY